LVLVTAHRRENFGKPLENICNSLLHIAERYGPALRIVYPVHFNPHVQEPVQRILGNVPNITLCQPLEYLSMVHLMKQSTLILTDSGGIQEEAPVFGVPVLVLRQVTERPEGVNAGVTRLVGTDANCIFNETCRLLDDPRAHAQMAQAVNPYGDGNAAARIIAAILAYSEKDHS
jgi:UDP-N-acetylglucosamine 2-epimerase (non-hydrolysing)